MTETIREHSEAYEPQGNGVDGWVEQLVTETPELGTKTELWARHVEAAHIYYESTTSAADPGIITLPEGALSPFGSAVQKLLCLFTNPEDFTDTLDHNDIATLLVTLSLDAEADFDALATQIERFTRDAYEVHIPWLKTGKDSLWDAGMRQYQKFWAVFGAMHIPH